ncbi:hypothetical protein [Sphingobium sp. EM0848]|uniref:hypothetical protein n=1 Tax=Sphingobium sp. EM0848 TaxID=2743473 RepID=UPI00159C2971|nr:hypothetical protein [Sphingobium sp. EM0848]
MVEDRRSESPIPFKDANEPTPVAGRSRGSFIIFVLVAIALILAIGFFYATKDNTDRQADALNAVTEAPDSAARVVSNAAKNAADAIQNRD